MKVSTVPAVLAGLAATVTLPSTKADAFGFSISRENGVLSWSVVSGRDDATSSRDTYNLPPVLFMLYSGPNDGTSVYREKYAPKVEDVVKDVTGLKVTHGDAKGTLDSIQKCANQTDRICLFVGQGNLLVDAPEVKDGKVCVVRTDLDPEYAYVFWQKGGIFSNNAFYSMDTLNSYDDVRAGWEAGTVTLVTSETSTGSVKTLENLAADIEKRLEGVDLKVQVLESWDAVKKEVKDNENAVGFTFRNGGGDTFLLDLQKKWNFAVAGFAERVLADNKTFEDGSPAFIFNDKAPYSEAGYIRNSQETTPALGSPVTLAANCPSRITNEVTRSVAVLTIDLLSNASRSSFSLAP